MSDEVVKKSRRKRAPAKAKAKAKAVEAAPTNLVYEHCDLFGNRLRILIEHATGIDDFVAIERFEKGKWKPVIRGLKALFDPVDRALDVAIIQQAMRLAEANATIAELRSPRTRPFFIKLMRHGLSGANTGEQDISEVPDHDIKLVEKGIKQARKAGGELGADFLREAMIYLSPYRRARQTMREALVGAGLIADSADELPVRTFEDPRLREVEHGYCGQIGIDAQKALRDKVGYFWYQLERGESPVSSFERVSGFLESFMRQMERKNARKALIVSHGLTIRVFIMRFFHLTVEQFDTMRNPRNCDVITIGPKDEIENPQFTSGRWAVTGLRLTMDGT